MRTREAESVTYGIRNGEMLSSLFSLPTVLYPKRLAWCLALSKRTV